MLALRMDCARDYLRQKSARGQPVMPCYALQQCEMLPSLTRLVGGALDAAGVGAGVQRHRLQLRLELHATILGYICLALQFQRQMSDTCTCWSMHGASMSIRYMER